MSVRDEIAKTMYEHEWQAMPEHERPAFPSNDWPSERDYWFAAADALMPIVERVAKEVGEQSAHVAYTGRLPDFDEIVRRVVGGTEGGE